MENSLLLQQLKQIDKKVNELNALLRNFESTRCKMKSKEMEKMVLEKTKMFKTQEERYAYRQGRTDTLLNSSVYE